MPICTNPNCGEISKSKTRFCPHCGQETLSYVRKDELGNLQEKPLTTEIFEQETMRSLAPQDLVRQKNSIFRKISQKKRSRRKLNIKKILGVITFIPIGALLIFFALDGSIQDSIAQKLGLQKQFSTEFNEEQLQFKFNEYADNGIPVYFKGCGPIDYFIRQNYASSEDISIVKTALSNLGDGAGRLFNFKGLTKESAGKVSPGSVLIDFTSMQESKELRKAEAETKQDVAGLGGAGTTEYTSKPRFNSEVTTDGTIWVNEKYWLEMNREDKIILIMHEMGHVLGLDHPVNGTNQIMDSGGYYSTSLGTGDLLGLQILSALGGCGEFPDYLKVGSSQNSGISK